MMAGSSAVERHDWGYAGGDNARRGEGSTPVAEQKAPRLRKPVVRLHPRQPFSGDSGRPTRTRLWPVRGIPVPQARVGSER